MAYFRTKTSITVHCPLTKTARVLSSAAVISTPFSCTPEERTRVWNAGFALPLIVSDPVRAAREGQRVFSIVNELEERTHCTGKQSSQWLFDKHYR